MKVSAALCLFVGAAPAYGQSPDGKTQVNDPTFIDMLNKVEGSTWSAGRSDFFHGFTFDDARKILGTKLSDISEHLDQTLDDSVYAAVGNDTVPAAFDAYTQWPGLMHPIRNQQQCGSCWAVSASEVLGDRFAIATNKASPVLSPEDMVSCDTGDMGCSGGQLPKAWEYLTSTGIVSESCFPYSAGSGTAPACTNKCVDSESWSSSKFKAKTGYAINGVLNVQKDLMTNGPVQVAFKVYKSFMGYKTGVYQKHFWELLPEGGHAVKVVGWGTDSGVDYWRVANSWDTTWGEEGFFRIRRGKNACGIETMGPPYAGMPLVSEKLVVV